MGGRERKGMGVMGKEKTLRGIREIKKSKEEGQIMKDGKWKDR